MRSLFNFAAGPAVLPEEVLSQAAEEMLDWHGSGMSVMEMSHRGEAFERIRAQAEADLRELLNIPKNYHVLFMQGGAQAQNAIVPLNLLRGKSSADYINTGIWSSKSIKEAQRYGQVNVAASSASEDPMKHFTHVPAYDTWRLNPDAAYVHVCSNETIGGVEYHWVPQTGEVPLVADMSSNILSREIEVSRYGLIYAGAQKNIGPSGLTLVIVRDDLVGQAHPLCPTVFNYQAVAEHQSMYNTPPTYAIYIAGLVFQWIKRQGGVAALEQCNIEKAKLLYDGIDESSFYHNVIDIADRSRMNIPFFLADESRHQDFLDAAKAAGLLNLKGHKMVGGMRASIYNAMPWRGVTTLVEFMRDFARCR